MPVYRMIFIGNLADMDADESDYDAEAAISLLLGQSFGSGSSPLYDEIVNVSMNETGGDGRIALNNAPGAQETVSYTLDGTDIALEVDSTIRARNVEITRQLPDGTTDTVTTTLRLFQDTDGNTFLMPPPLSGGEPGEVGGVTTYPIISIEFSDSSVDYVTRYTHVFSDRYNVTTFVPCFTSGTLIRTDSGDVPVEQIRPGDLILTKDHGLQPVRWCGRRDLKKDQLRANPRLRPICIAAGALGNGLPLRDLVVSPQHRILVRSRIAVRMFGCMEILVAAIKLIGLPGIETCDTAENVTYVHLMFDQHEVIQSEGAETESFYPGKMAMQAIGPQAATEIFALFPELKNDEVLPAAARELVSGHRARSLTERHLRNGRPLLS